MNKYNITSCDLNVTENCCLRCDYCFKKNKHPKSISYKMACNIIDWLFENSNKDSISIWFFGGEPLMEFDLITNIVDNYTKRNNRLTFGATTNLILINDNIIKYWLKNKMTWNTSIDGCPETQDKHRKFSNGKPSSIIVEKNAIKILKEWPNVTARSTSLFDTCHNLYNDVRYLLDLGYKNIAQIIAPEGDWCDDYLSIVKDELNKIGNHYIKCYENSEPFYYKTIDDTIKAIVNPERRIHHCGAGRGLIAVDCYGNIWPCHRFSNMLEPEWWDINLGNIRDGIDLNRKAYFDNFNCHHDVKKDCSRCIAINLCGIPCIACNYEMNGDIALPHINACKLKEIEFIEGMRVYNVLHGNKNSLFMKKLSNLKSDNKNNSNNTKYKSGTMALDSINRTYKLYNNNVLLQ